MNFIGTAHSSPKPVYVPTCVDAQVLRDHMTFVDHWLTIKKALTNTLDRTAQ